MTELVPLNPGVLIIWGPNPDYAPMDPGEITPEMAAQLEEAKKLWKQPND